MLPKTSPPLKNPSAAPVKTRQIGVQMPGHQALVLKQYRIQHGRSADAVVLAALCVMIEGLGKR